MRRTVWTIALGVACATARRAATGGAACAAASSSRAPEDGPESGGVGQRELSSGERIEDATLRGDEGGSP